MVHKVSLAGLNKTFNNNNNKITSHLTNLKGKTFVIEYDKNAEQWNRQVVLKELQSNISINDEIQKLLSNDNSSLPTSQQRRLERKIILPEKIKSTLEKPSHPIKSGSHVFITHFENFSSIFIRDASYEFIENFNAFNKQMLKYYRNANNSSSTKEKLKVGDKVCVKSLLNLIMFSRAIIIDIKDNKYNVFYLDYGNTEIVNSEDILDLPKELEKFQDFIIKVKLQNMPELNTENEMQVIKNHFNKNFIIPGATLSIEFNEFNPKGLEDVILKTEYYKKDIVEDIRDLLNAPLLNIKIAGQDQNKEQNHGRYPFPARKLKK